MIVVSAPYQMLFHAISIAAQLWSQHGVFAIVIATWCFFWGRFDIESSWIEVCISNISLYCVKADPMIHSTLDLDHYCTSYMSDKLQ